MARPTKAGLDYFPLDCDIDRDSAVRFVEARHGIEGFAVFVRLLCRIYREGYFTRWDARERALFARDVAMSETDVETIVQTCADEGLFSREKLDTYGVLTSRGIQLRYLVGTTRRISVKVLQEYMMSVDDADGFSHATVVSVDRNTARAGFAREESTQSKVKESKVKESVCASDAFERFWLAFPWHRYRDKAHARFDELVASGQDAETIIDAAALYALRVKSGKAKQQSAHYFLEDGTWRDFALRRDCPQCDGAGFTHDGDVAVLCERCDGKGREGIEQ